MQFNVYTGTFNVDEGKDNDLMHFTAKITMDGKGNYVVGDLEPVIPTFNDFWVEFVKRQTKK